MSREELDPRVLAFDTERRWAEVGARGRVEPGDWQFTQPQPRLNGPQRLGLRAGPDDSAPQVTEALPGEALEVVWEQDDWARIRTVHDGYLGWVKAAALQIKQAPGPDELTVTALRAHAFAGPQVSRAIVAELSFGTRVWRGAGDVVQEDGRRWGPVLLPDGEHAWVPEVCFAAVPERTVMAFARRLLDTPYVWGGRSAWGLDCSGLTQLVYGAFGVRLPRDTDQQQAALEAVSEARPGDLAFFPGHVGLMLDDRRMVHANATHMRVTVETLGEGEYGQRLRQGCTGFGRPA